MTRWARRPSSAVTNNKRLSLFDQAENKKQQGMNAAYQHADTIWKKAAGDALRHVALNNLEFTSDDVWHILEEQGIHTGDNRAMGAIMQSANRAGIIEHTSTYKQTQRVQAHKRPLAVWRSKIFKG